MAEKALTAVIEGLRAGRLDPLGGGPGAGDGDERLSKSQVSRLCGEIDDKVKRSSAARSRATGRICGSTPPT